MPGGSEQVDHLGAPQTQRLPWPAVMNPCVLHISFDATASDIGGVDRCLRNAATRSAELRNGADLRRNAVACGPANVGDRAQSVHEMMHLVEQVVGSVDRLQVIELASTQLAIEVSGSVDRPSGEHRLGMQQRPLRVLLVPLGPLETTTLTHLDTDHLRTLDLAAHSVLCRTVHTHSATVSPTIQEIPHRAGRRPAGQSPLSAGMSVGWHAESVKPLVPFVRNADWEPHDVLVAELRAAMPEFDLVLHADVPPDRRAEPTVAIVDGPSAEQLAALPNLRFVQSTWAGVEAILPAVPDGVEVARMVDPQLALTMAEAVLAWTLFLHRDMPRYARQQQAGEWCEHPPVRATNRRVGILGLGALGVAAATTLRDQRFDVAGWSRSPKSIEDVACFDGDDGLTALLERSDIVVNLLPHTAATNGLLDARAFARLPSGASVINFGRGQTIDDDALLDALDAGHLDHAVLDVFDIEPLPGDHRFWTHPNVTVLPHISGPTSADTAAVIAAENVRRFLADGTMPADALVDRSRGY